MRSDIYADLARAKAAERSAFDAWQFTIRERRQGNAFDDKAEELAYKAWCVRNRMHDELINELLGNRRRLLFEQGN